MELFDVFKQVYHIGQCNPNDINFTKLKDWWEQWETESEFLNAIEEWYENWLKNNPDLIE